MPRVTTKNEDRQFLESVINDSLLEIALAWISSNMEPEDVFDESTLQRWAKKEGYSQKE